MIRYSLTIFLSALLLFLIQPLAARSLLPFFGGTSTVWIASMMFFQTALLAGYLYAHWIRVIFSPRSSWIVHSIAIGVSFYLLNFTEFQTDRSYDSLSLGIFYRLAITVGLPFCILSGSAPLIQAWQSSTHRHDVYRLYAASNVGSLCGLLGYPFILEQWALKGQTQVWSYLFLGCGVMLVWSGVQTRLCEQWNEIDVKENDADGKRPRAVVMLSWIVVTASASTLLIASTNILCLEVASYPFLWVLPLALYLISFIVSFERPRWYRRKWWLPVFALSVFGGILLLHLGSNAGLILQTAGFGLVVFAGAMICHGELYRLRPDSIYLTLFYLCVAGGGAAGSAFAVIVAPMVFDHYFEFHLAIIACLVIVTGLVWLDAARNRSIPMRHFFVTGILAMVAGGPVVCSWLFLTSSEFQRELVFRARNEYGVVSVRDEGNYRKMYNGHTHHGGQFLDKTKSHLPSAYYTEGSGVAVAFSAMRSLQQDLNICVIGLGTGSMLSYKKADDRFRFYEINPLAYESAKLHFTYLSEFDADVIIGDGRREMQKENQAGEIHSFDLIFVDAFSSDSIPVHLLTSECVDLYLKNLTEDGILVFHITNRFVDLLPVIKSIEEENELSSILVNHHNPEFNITTKWVLFSRNRSIWNQSLDGDIQYRWGDDVDSVKWTDQYSSVAPLVIWSGNVRIGN